jgi:riboflavin synthase
MFTGLIEAIGRVERSEHRGNYLLLTVAPSLSDFAVADGDSISCDGACLTIVSHTASDFSVEASQETIARTTLGNWRLGTRMHLERSLRADSRLGGHFVSGHIDCTGKIERIQRIGDSLEVIVQFDNQYDRLVVSKGSIAINGVSLTINECGDGLLSVNLIPFTLKSTTFETLRPGDRVNLEFDILAKYIARQHSQSAKAGLTMEKLLESGW